MGPKFFTCYARYVVASPKKSGEEGFSLVEVIIAFVIFLIALFGIFTVFTYSINYNTGNNSRAQALAVLQQEVEQLRSAKFTPSVTDASLVGGTKAPKTIVASNGNRFVIDTTVDDDPFTTGVQTNTAKTLKEITITVSLESPTPGWQTAVPTTVILRRVRAN